MIRFSDRCAALASIAFFFCLCSTLTSCQSPHPTTPEPAVTTITIGPEVLRTQVKRLGINLSGQTFYDSGQMLRNMTYRNPGFEGGTWQSILRCKTVTPTSCTDENPYTVWPANFLQNASYEIISGADRGSTGVIQSSTAAGGNQGVTLTLSNSARSLAPGDFLLARIDKPGNAQAGWWTDLQGGATLSTEFHDLSPHTPGKQALRIEAAGPGQSANIDAYFDTLAQHSFVQLRGPYTLAFRAKSLKPAGSVNVTLQRLDTTHGLHIFFRKTIPLAPEWRDFTLNFTGDESRSALGSVVLNFAFAQTSALLDDVALTATAAPSNPTVFRDEVVQTLRDLHPGVLRDMDNGDDFGSSLDNMLAPPFARRRTGASTQQSLQEDIPIGLHEFLVLCKAVDAEPWYTLPPGTSTAEAAALVEYLAGPSTSHYGALRAALGQREPWTQVFPTIHLELGNEQWNNRSFVGATLHDPTAYGQRATRIFSALRAAPGFNPARFDLIVGTFTAVPWWTQQEIASASAFDTVAIGPYFFNDFNDASTPEAIFGPMFAEPEAMDSRPRGLVAQQAAVVSGASSHATSPREIGSHKLAVYEVNLGALSGSPGITQADLDRALPSLGGGLAVADHMLLMLRDLGITTQCLFALPEYQNGFPAPGPKRTVPLWGAVVDMGGSTGLRRPQFLAEQLINAAILPTMLTTHLAGPTHTWNQPESLNGKVRLDGAHELQTFAFSDGARHSLILLNLSRTEAIPIAFAGSRTPSSPVEESVLTSTNIEDSNEQRELVRSLHHHLANFPATYQLPPHSLTTLSWTH